MKKTTKLTPQIIGTCIIIDDILYKPLRVADESIWYKCRLCDYRPRCYKKSADISHCNPFGDNMVLQGQGKINEITIEEYERHDKD